MRGCDSASWCAFRFPCETSTCVQVWSPGPFPGSTFLTRKDSAEIPRVVLLCSFLRSAGRERPASGSRSMGEIYPESRFWPPLWLMVHVREEEDAGCHVAKEGQKVQGWAFPGPSCLYACWGHPVLFSVPSGLSECMAPDCAACARSLVKIVRDGVVRSPGVIRKVREGGDVQNISLQQEREIPCSKRYNHVHMNRIAVIGRGCRTGIAGRRAAGAEEVCDQNISICRDLNSDPVAGLRIHVIPDTYEVLQRRCGRRRRCRSVSGRRCRRRRVGRSGRRSISGGRRGRVGRSGRGSISRSGCECR